MSVQLTSSSNAQSAVIAQQIQENSTATANVDTKAKHNSEISLAASDYSPALESRDVIFISLEEEAVLAGKPVTAPKAANVANIDPSKIAEMNKYVSDHFNTISKNLKTAQKFLDNLNAKNLFGKAFADINKFIKESNDVIEAVNKFHVQINNKEFSEALETYERIKFEFREAEEAFEPVKKIFNDALKDVASCCAALFSNMKK